MLELDHARRRYAARSISIASRKGVRGSLGISQSDGVQALSNVNKGARRSSPPAGPVRVSRGSGREHREREMIAASILSQETARQLRARSTQLRVEFLEAEIGNCFAVLSMAQTNRRLGFQEAHDRGIVLARKGYRMALYLRATLHGADEKKLASLSERIDFLRRVMEEDAPIDSFNVEAIEANREAVAAKTHPEKPRALTPREHEVLTLIVAGRSTKEIAWALGVSFKTAVSHRSTIMSKLGASNTASLVRDAILKGLA